MAGQVGVKAHFSEGPDQPAPKALRECTVITQDGSRILVSCWDTFSTRDFNGFSQYWFEYQGKTVAVFPVHVVMALVQFKDM